MYSNYSIIIDKVEYHEDYVWHIFRSILSGTNSTSNRFIEIKRYDWDTETKLPSVEIIKNANDKYNYMLAKR